MNDLECFRVAAILPFFRYAVCPTSGHSPGIPFFREASARDFFEEAKRELPWAGVLLLRKKWGKLEIIEEYQP